MARKTKKNNEIVDGKIEELTPRGNVTAGKSNARSIDELLGRTVASYSTGNIDDYEAKIRNYTLADLQSHAASIGLLPVSNKSTLINRLLTEFRKKSRGYYNTATFNTIEPKNKEQTLKAIQKASGA